MGRAQRRQTERAGRVDAKKNRPSVALIDSVLDRLIAAFNSVQEGDHTVQDLGRLKAMGSIGLAFCRKDILAGKTSTFAESMQAVESLWARSRIGDRSPATREELERLEAAFYVLEKQLYRTSLFVFEEVFVQVSKTSRTDT